MDKRQKKIDLEYDDVIRFNGYTYTVRQVKEALSALLADKGDLGEQVREYFRNRCVPMANIYNNLFNEPEGEGLQQSGGGWKEGKLQIQFVLETCYDEEEPEDSEESESPLDDIRRSLNENGS